MSTCSIERLIINPPRLELLACLLLSEQMKVVFDAISIQIIINEIFCWSDSQISLWRVKQFQKSWKIWVENHVEKIRSNVPTHCWRYIRTDQNPADIVMRQVTASVWPEAMLDGSKVAGGKKSVYIKL